MKQPPARKKVEQHGWQKGYVFVTLSCGHTLLVESYSRQSAAKTLRRYQCLKLLRQAAASG